MEGATVVFVFAEPSVQEDVKLRVLVLIEEPKVSEGLFELVFELSATTEKVVDEWFSWGFTGEGKDDSSSVGKSVYGGAGHSSSA